ncbi:hypothetical protein MNBD_DELTA04-1841, partial [hydrothermal vent metagenome]
FEYSREELYEAALLVHVIDVSNPAYVEQVEVVEFLLRDLELDHIPCLRVFNKIDLLDEEARAGISRMDGVGICALDPAGLTAFLQQAQAMLRA